MPEKAHALYRELKNEFNVFYDDKGAVGRRYRGYGIGGSILVAVMIVFVSQALIWSMTAISYLAGIHTYFNDPVAINGSPEPIGLGAAMISRTITFVANCVVGAILGAIGWALGGLIPAERI